MNDKLRYSASSGTYNWVNDAAPRLTRDKKKKATFSEMMPTDSDMGLNMQYVFSRTPGSRVKDSGTRNERGVRFSELFVSGSQVIGEWVIRGFRDLIDFYAYYIEVEEDLDAFIQFSGTAHGGDAPLNAVVNDIVFRSKENLQQLCLWMVKNDYVSIDGIPVQFDERNMPCLHIQNRGHLWVIHSNSYDRIADLLRELDKHATIRKRETSLTMVTGIDPNGELVLKHEKLSAEYARRAHASFYPWMEGMTPAEYFLEYMESSANVWLGFGTAGTGKSTLLQTACLDLGLSALLVTDTSLASNPNFVGKLGEKMAGENGGQYDLLIVEDGDALMLPRTQGNVGLSSILTATDGMGVSRKFKLAVTTNAETTENIDAALLRPGRCFDIMEFGALTPKEANVVRSDMGLPAHKFSRSTVLASVLNPTTKTMKSAQDGKTSIVAPRFPLRRPGREADKA